MEVVSPFEWERLMFGVEPPLYLLEIIVRVVLIYVYAVLALRYMGKRGRQALSPFELVSIIALGSATGDAMFYPGGIGGKGSRDATRGGDKPLT